MAHTEFDLARPKQNEGNAGFTKEEREDFTHLKKSVGLIDVYRHKYPDNPGYTYFSYRANSRANYVGWRLDYFLVSENLLEKVKDCAVLDAYIDEGKWVSDHVPLTLELVLCDG